MPFPGWGSGDEAEEGEWGGDKSSGYWLSLLPVCRPSLSREAEIALSMGIFWITAYAVTEVRTSRTFTDPATVATDPAHRADHIVRDFTVVGANQQWLTTAYCMKFTFTTAQPWRPFCDQPQRFQTHWLQLLSVCVYQHICQPCVASDPGFATYPFGVSVLLWEMGRMLTAPTSSCGHGSWTSECM